jgi:hypothetical protein
MIGTMVKQWIFFAGAVFAGAVFAGAVFAQTNPGMSGRGLSVTIARDSSRDRVVSYEYDGPVGYVRIEMREAGAATNEHPAPIEAVRVRAVLQSVRMPSEKNEQLFNDTELDEISVPLSRALGRASPQQDVSFAVSGKHGGFGPLAPRTVTTARIFRVDGHLNMVFGLVRHDWDNTFHATGVVMPFEPGHRAAPLPNEPSVAVDAKRGTSHRSDWLVFNELGAFETAHSPASADPPQPRPSATPPASAIEQRLEILERLRQKGMVTEQEYQEKRRAILKDL